MFATALGFLIVAIFFAIVVFGASIKIVNEWERLAILTLGKFSGLKGPGFVMLVPFIQTVANRIDIRVRTSKFASETTLSKDGVTITIDAVLFWRVIDTEKATLQVNNYQMAVEMAALTTLRDVIGRMNLADILSNIEELDLTIKENIARKVIQWGIEAQAVEITDVQIPEELQEVMSRAAQAEREKQARITYGEAEIEAAKKFVEASEIYASKPNAIQLRAMSIMNEALSSDKNSLIIAPSNMTDTLNPAYLAAAWKKPGDAN